jgi:hypothetical protein
VAVVALVSFDLLALLKEVREDFVENCNLGKLTSRVGMTLNPHQVPCKDVDAQLAALGGLPPFGFWGMLGCTFL